MLTFLFVCTGNICRSPLAHALMADRSRRLLDGSVRVISAGTWAGRGNPATSEMISIARERGVDASAHRSRPLDEPDVAAADLILGMTRAQVEEILELAPEAAPRTFLLKELATLLGAMPAVGRLDEPAVRDRILAAHALRLGSDAPALADPDVADPIGLGMDAYRDVGWDIELAVDALLEGLFGVRQPAAAGGA